MKDKVFKVIGASNHIEKEREMHDFYATNPLAIDGLLDGLLKYVPQERLYGVIW